MIEERLRMSELDEWFRQEEMTIEKAIGHLDLNWAMMSYEKKLALHESFKAECRPKVTVSQATKHYYDNPSNIMPHYPNDRVNGYVLLTDGKGNLFVPELSKHGTDALAYCQTFMELGWRIGAIP